MANVNIKFNGKEFLLSCEDGQEEHLEELSNYLNQKFKLGKNFYLGYSPEREDPGNKKFSLEKKNIPKIVSGYTADCLSLTKLLYSKISKTISPKLGSISSIFKEFCAGLGNILKFLCFSRLTAEGHVEPKFILIIGVFDM